MCHNGLQQQQQQQQQQQLAAHLLVPAERRLVLVAVQPLAGGAVLQPHLAVLLDGVAQVAGLVLHTWHT